MNAKGPIYGLSIGVLVSTVLPHWPRRAVLRRSAPTHA